MSPRLGAGASRSGSGGAKGRLSPRARWMLAALILVVIVVTAVAGIFWVVLALAGLVWLFFGLVAMSRGSASFARIRSRWAGALAVVVGLVALVMGGVGQGVVYTMSSTTQNSAASLAAVATASPFPTATTTPKPTATATGHPAATSKATTPTPTATPTPTPVASRAEVQEASVIPYGAVTVDDSNIDVGASAVSVGGGNGEKVTTYIVEYLDGVEISRSVAREEVTVQPVDEVTSIGTRVPPPVVAAPEPEPANDGCDTNYADACVPIAFDVDCAGGSGDGPGYVDGPVRIVGSDIYRLDNDDDGVACDS
jgi:hypothetical protein